MRVYVDELAKNEDGRLELARFAAAYLVARPAKAEPAPVAAADDDDLDVPVVEDRETERAREDAARGDDGGRGGRRRSRGGGGRAGRGGRGGNGGSRHRRRRR